MSHSSTGLDFFDCSMDGNPELSCDDEIGAVGILEQGMTPLSLCGEQRQRRMIFKKRAAGCGEGGTDHLGVRKRTNPDAKKWMLVLLGWWFNALCSPPREGGGRIAHLGPWDVAHLAWWINVMLNWAAARGGEGGIAHLDLCEVVQFVMWINLLMNQVAAARRGTPHLAGYERLEGFLQLLLGQGGLLGRWVSVLLKRGAARRGPGRITHLEQWEVVEFAKWINMIVRRDPARSGDGRIELFYWRDLSELTDWMNMMLEMGGARGGIAHLDKWEVLRVVNRINVLLNQGAARGGEGNTAHLAGLQINPRAPGTSRLWNRAAETHTIDIDREPNNNILEWSAARGAEGNTAHLARTSRPWNNMLLESHNIKPMTIESWIQKMNNNVLFNRDAAGSSTGGTSHLPQSEIYPEIDLADFPLPNQDAVGGNEQLPDSMPLNMSTSLAYNPPGPGTSGPRNRTSSPGRTQAVESHNIDIKDEETDKKFSEWSNALTILAMVDSSTLGLLGTGVQGADVLMPKNYSKTILGLFTVSLTGLFCIGVFYKKLPAKFANPATYLTFACNASAFFLLAVFYLINI